MVQVVITLIGLITIIAGVLPFVGSLAGLPLSILSGVGYSIIISIIGILGLLYGFTSMALIGETKFVMIALGLLTLLGGIIPFIKNIIPLDAVIQTGWAEGQKTVGKSFEAGAQKPSRFDKLQTSLPNQEADLASFAKDDREDKRPFDIKQDDSCAKIGKHKKLFVFAYLRKVE